MSDNSLIAFDLDGTLLDTAQDFLLAVNILEKKHGVKKSSFQDIRSRVSEGALALTKFALNIKNETPGLGELKDELLNIYFDCCLNKTEPFSGINELLTELDKANMTWGIVTNKPLKYAEKIVKTKLGTFNYKFLICPDHTNSRKPDPSGLLLANKITKSKPSSSFYIGDHKTDIEAGINAGMKTIAVSYGYIPINDSAKKWGADICVDKPIEILAHINS